MLECFTTKCAIACCREMQTWDAPIYALVRRIRDTSQPLDARARLALADDVVTLHETYLDSLETCEARFNFLIATVGDAGPPIALPELQARRQRRRAQTQTAGHRRPPPRSLQAAGESAIGGATKIGLIVGTRPAAARFVAEACAVRCGEDPTLGSGEARNVADGAIVQKGSIAKPGEYEVKTAEGTLRGIGGDAAGDVGRLVGRTGAPRRRAAVIESQIVRSGTLAERRVVHLGRNGEVGCEEAPDAGSAAVIPKQVPASDAKSSVCRREQSEDEALAKRHQSHDRAGFARSSLPITPELPGGAAAELSAVRHHSLFLQNDARLKRGSRTRSDCANVERGYSMSPPQVDGVAGHRDGILIAEKGRKQGDASMPKAVHCETVFEAKGLVPAASGIEKVQKTVNTSVQPAEKAPRRRKRIVASLEPAKESNATKRKRAMLPTLGDALKRDGQKAEDDRKRNCLARAPVHYPRPCAKCSAQMQERLVREGRRNVQKSLATWASKQKCLARNHMDELPALDEYGQRQFIEMHAGAAPDFESQTESPPAIDPV